MSEPFKICPICDTANHRNAVVCRMCGTTLAGVETLDSDAPAAQGIPAYDYRYGETDLFEESLNRKAQVYMGGIVLFLFVIMGIGLVFAFYPSFTQVAVEAATRVGVSVPVFQTNTAAPTRIFPTVTEGLPTLTATFTLSPTPTITPTFTRTPCMQTVQAGEGLYDVVSRCGHFHLEVVDPVVELNDLNDETDIFAGQVLEIPWPTETPGANLTEEAQPEAAADVNASAAIAVEVTEAPMFTSTPTLQPGLAYHTVISGEDIISITMLYDTSLEVMAQINPEVVFSQCEFGQRFSGGEDCVVLLYEGQVIRVPAPTPTPTLSPTPSGSETATPTATPTFNAPSAISPGNRAYFRKDEIVTLRWLATGALGAGQKYRVRVEDRTGQQIYIADTQDLFFVIPEEWHGRGSQRYEYVWTVSIIDEASPDEPQFTTGALTFTWEGLGE